MTQSTDVHVRWPTERFYWAVLDASVIPGGRRASPAQLGYLLEPTVPQPIEELHAIYHPLPERRYLACALARAELDSVPATALTLTPASIPHFVEADIGADLGAERLNLLTGPCTPTAVRRHHRRWLVQVAALCAACALIVLLGFERRIRAQDLHHRELTEATDAIYRQALGGARSASALPLELQLESEWRSLRQTRTAALPRDEPDAAVSLAHLLSLWPADIPLQTQSLLVSPDSIHVTGQVATTQGAQQISDALEPIAGWNMRHPVVRSVGDQVSLTLHYDREAPPEERR